MRIRAALAAATLALCAGATACGGDGQASSVPAGAGRPVRVVTTTTELTDFVRQVGGDHVQVYGVLKPNVDPHDFEASPADLQQIADADLVVENGVGLEKWFDTTIASASPRGTIVDASDGVPLRDGDPHIWQNPQNAVVMVANIVDALVQLDPAHRGDYESNQRAYEADLRALDDEIRARLASLTDRRLVTNHDAFGYYIDHYGLQFVGAVIPSFDSQAELSPRDITDLVARIKATGVKAVFSERSLPPRTAEAIAEQAGVVVVAGEDALYGDGLGEPGSDADTYLRMMRHNTREIVDNLS